MASPALARRSLRRLDRSALRAFVRDLYAARGWTTRVVDDVVVLCRDGQRRVVWVVPAGWRSRFRRASPDRQVDVVVTPADGQGRLSAVADAHDARLVDGHELAETLWYGVTADQRERLCTRHVGAAPHALKRSPLARVDATIRGTVATSRRPLQRVATGTGRPSSAGSLATFATVLLVTGLVVASVAGPALPTVTDHGEPAATGRTSTTVLTTANPSETAVFVPGLDETGVVDADRLAEAHRGLLEATSYRMTYTRVQPARTTAGPVQTRRAGSLVSDGERLSLRRFDCGGAPGLTDVYVTENGSYTAHYDGTEVSFTVDREGEASGRYPARTAQLVRQYLNASRTTVVETETGTGSTYLVTAHGRPPVRSFTAASNYTAKAVVTTDGLVTRFGVEYAVEAANETLPVRITIEYADVGRARVQRPPWYDPPLRNGTMNATSNLWFYMKSASRRHCRTRFDGTAGVDG